MMECDNCGELKLPHHICSACGFYNKKEIVTYKNIQDLNKKIIFYKNKPRLLRDIACRGHKKAHRIFNNKIVSDYIVKRSMNLKINYKLPWING